MRNAIHQLIEVNHFVQTRIAHNLRHQRYMHRMSRPLRNYLPQNWPSDQCQIANQIKHLVPHWLIGVTQTLRIQYPLLGETNRILKRGPTNQPHISHLIQLMLETKSACRSNIFGITVWSNFKLQFLPTYHWVIKENITI